MNISIKKIFREGIKWNVVFLTSVVFTVFVIPVFPAGIQKLLYDASFTLIFLLGFINSDRKHPAFLPLSISAMVLIWISSKFDLPLLFSFSYSLNILFFVFVIAGMVKHLIVSQTVTPRLILEAIIIYLLIGLIFAMIISLIDHFDSSAFSFPIHDLNTNIGRLNDFIYYTFITLSTTGYGDIIPLKPYSRSIAIFIAITGQMYIAIVIAMLVGKFAAGRQFGSEE